MARPVRCLEEDQAGLARPLTLIKDDLPDRCFHCAVTATEDRYESP
jgi:hypothetical protein